MLGIVIVTHGNLCDEFLKALEHIMGKQENISAVPIYKDDDMLKAHDLIDQEIFKVNEGDGVIVLTDMFGGTPSNLAIAASNKDNVEVIAGVNLPLLIKLAKLRDELDIKSVTKQAEEAGKKHIKVVGDILKK